MSESKRGSGQGQGQRFPCRCEHIMGNALCFACLHEQNLRQEQYAGWKKRNGNGGDGR